MPVEPERPRDEPAEREIRFARQQGISELAYAQLLGLAHTHAAAASAFPAPPSWRHVGPRNVGGRIIALDQDPDDPRIVYVGSAQGGLWRSIDAGDQWERLGQPSDAYPVGALAVAPTAPRVIYFGTGAQIASYISGQGLFRATLDTPTGSPHIEQLAPALPPSTAPLSATAGSALRYTRIRVDPDDPTRFWVASQTGLWRCECPLDAPATAARITRDLPDGDNQPSGAALLDHIPGDGIWPSHCTDLLLARDPRSDETTGERKVPRYLILYVAIEGQGVFRGRFDRESGRTTFESARLSIPVGVAFRRVRLAQCEAQPQHVYAVFEVEQIIGGEAHRVASEVFHSDDNGERWSAGQHRIGPPDRARFAYYVLVLEVAPHDPSIVVLGAVDLFLSRDFGNHWTSIMDWTRNDAGDAGQHADQHALLFDRGDHRRLWVGNDGGLSLARDVQLPAQSPGYWRKRSHGIYAGQAQDVSASPAHSFICGIGLQDAGTYVSLGGPTWYHMVGGDGGACAFDRLDPRRVFGTTQNGISQVVPVPADAAPGVDYDVVLNAAADLPDGIARGHRVRYRVARTDAGMRTHAAPWVGVLETHPSARGNFLAGRRGDAYATTNLGLVWSPILGGPGTEVSALAFGPADPRNPLPGNVAWAGTADGRLAFTASAPDAGWAFLPNLPTTASPLPFPGLPLRISEIVVHPLDRRIVVVAATGIYGCIFLSYDQGRSWQDVTVPVPSALDIRAPASTIRIDETCAYRALATYPALGGEIDVTARAAWASDDHTVAVVGSSRLDGSGMPEFGTEGQVTGRGAGHAHITARLSGTGAAPSVRVDVITPALPPPQPRIPATPAAADIPGSLPPGPISSVIFDPAPGAGTAATLLAGTLVGVYALPNVPVVQALEIRPPGPLNFPLPSPDYQLRCLATFTDGTQVEVSADVDWSSDHDGAANPNVPGNNPGQLRFGAAGAARITAQRGGRAASVDIIVGAPGPPAAVLPLATAQPRVPVAWQLYNNGLPQVLVTDFERVGNTNAIRASTFGLGVFECVTAGGHAQWLYIRQTLVEDGRTYPRPAVPPVPDDPRLPAGIVALDYTHAFDIRVDAPPYSFFDDVVDGVEFEEQLEVADPVPTEDNYVYVQVHNAGTSPVPNVLVHLYAAPCAAGDVVHPIGNTATPSPASLQAGGVAEFYGRAGRDPPGLLADVWKRVDSVRTLDAVQPDAPRVVRFTWRPDAALQNRDVALLALCDGATDGLPATPGNVAGPLTLSDFILAERRAALRIVHVAPQPPASLYIRDGIADDTLLGGYPVAGRSPDIMVVHPDITDPPADAFKDPIARRPGDTVSASEDTFVYVRVHNRRRYDTAAGVKLYAIPLDDAGRPVGAPAAWSGFPAGAGVFEPVSVAARGVGYARIALGRPADPNPDKSNKTYLLLALVQHDPGDLLPDVAAAAEDFWDAVTRYVDSDNAAARAVPWVPAVEP